MPKVSVIIPVYNVEEYIERCLHSLFSQSLQDIEFIFVDDGSTDTSLKIISKILKEYPKRQNQLKILRHETNKGVSAARLTGILAAEGEYLIHCDPDDYVDTMMYEKLYNKIKNTNADIVICNSVLVEENCFHENDNKEYTIPSEYLDNWFTSKCNYYPLWDKLIKRSLIIENKIFPTLGISVGEDFECVVKAFYYAEKIVVEKSRLYYYCKRPNSITNSAITPEIVKIKLEVAQRVSEFFRLTKFNIFSNNFKFHTKLQLRPFFIDKKEEWFEIFPECHKYILKYKDNPIKVRLFWFFILKNKKIFRFSQKWFDLFE